MIKKTMKINHPHIEMKSKQKTYNGFTLIELLVVISIIGVLALMIVPNLVGMRERARDAKKKSELVQFKKALQLYYNDNQNYPSTGPTIGSAFTDATDPTIVYMGIVPEYDAYDSSTDGDSFVVKIALENEADQDISNSQDTCSAALSAAGISVSVTAATDYVVCQD